MTNKECQSQIKLRDRLEDLGLSLIEDFHSLADSIGTVRTVPVLLDGITPKGLYRFYIQGEPNPKAYHLVSPKFLKEGLVVGEYYTLPFVIGVRRVSYRGYVISLRRPRTNKVS